MQFHLLTVAALATASYAAEFSANLNAGATLCMDLGVDAAATTVTCHQAGPGPKFFEATQEDDTAVLLTSTSTGTVSFKSVTDGAVAICVKNIGTATILATVACA